MSSQSESDSSIDVLDDNENPSQPKDRKTMMRQKKPTLYDDDGSECSDDERSVTAAASVSLETLKHKILGRSVQSYGDSPENRGRAESIAATSDLRRELSCIICHDVMIQPVSLHCGHSFCGPCLNWWLGNSTSETNNGNCPTCRTPLVCEGSMLGVNTTIRACVQTLYEDDYRRRLAALEREEERATAGENGGAHNEGYQETTKLTDDRWRLVGLFHVRRSIVMDTEDKRMRLSMGLNGIDCQNPIIWKPNNVLQVYLCLLLMEEDEVEDSGFPLTVKDIDDEHCIANEERFLSTVEVTGELDSGSGVIPVARRQTNVEGKIVFALDMKKEGLHLGCRLNFQHHESGLQLEIRVPAHESSAIVDEPKEGVLEQQMSSYKANAPGRFVLDRVESNENTDVDEESEDDGGFIVDDDEELSTSSFQECQICHVSSLSSLRCKVKLWYFSDLLE